MFNYRADFMLSHEEESSDLAAKPNAIGWLSRDLSVYAGREGKVCPEDSTCENWNFWMVPHIWVFKVFLPM